jgi:alpha-glucosidase
MVKAKSLPSRWWSAPTGMTAARRFPHDFRSASVAVESLGSGQTGRATPRFGDDWWKRGTIYQIYPRSFADSTGDGTGDLRGIIDHLDHLDEGELGVDAIWLSPIYPSPGRDIGYDVSDHGAIDPRFGTEADFDELVDACHRRGLRVILDLVMNHTSSDHPWFAASRAAREGMYAEWYIWRDPTGSDRRGQPLPPNNWVSWFGGPAWTYEPGRGQFYLHTFLAEQPDLNWRHPGVEEAQLAMVRRWLERGVDGFRLDVFNAFLKAPDLAANPRRRGRSDWARQEHRYDIDQPDLPELMARFRAVLDAQPGRMSVGELFTGTTERAADLTTERHLVFDWELLTRPWSAAAFRAAILRHERAFREGRWPTVVLSNHDQPRHASRLAASAGGGPAIQDAVAKAAAVLLLTMRGTPFVYYGEELGLGDVPIAPNESIDSVASNIGPDFPWWDRSPARTPMPWRSGPGAGFTTGQPWLRLGSDADRRNVQAQTGDPMSVLGTYRRLLAARRSSRSLQEGSIALLRTGDPTVLGYRRVHPGSPEVMVLVAFGPGEGHVTIPRSVGTRTWRPIVGTHPDVPDLLAPGSELRLRPYEGIVALAAGPT